MRRLKVRIEGCTWPDIRASAINPQTRRGAFRKAWRRSLLPSHTH
jgi:hypothetical protein